jgi:hypothetical protein
MFFLYGVFLATVAVTNYTFYEWVVSDNANFVGAALSLLVLIVILNSVFMLLEGVQLLEMLMDPDSGFWAYVVDPQNWIDLPVHTLIYAGSLIRLLKQQETTNSSSIFSVATLLLFFKLLHFLRPYQSTGPLVRMIFHIFYRIKEFLAIVVAVIFGFSQAIYLLSYQDDSLDFADPLFGTLHGFFYMLGGSQIDQMTGTSNPN